jgi:hypothetical protein
MFPNFLSYLLPLLQLSLVSACKFGFVIALRQCHCRKMPSNAAVSVHPIFRNVSSSWSWFEVEHLFEFPTMKEDVSPWSWHSNKVQIHHGAEFPVIFQG